MRAADGGGAWPTEPQRRLLRAALTAGEAGWEAWRHWRAIEDPERADAASGRLFPLVYLNLRDVAHDDPAFRRLASAYRREWYFNNVLFARTGATLDLLHGAGARTLLLKGAPLAHLCYPAPGGRAMDDVDVLVPRADAHRAIDVLEDAGYASESGMAHEMVDVRHADSFEHPEGWLVDLHWSALAQPGSDDALWQASVPFALAGADTRTLCATDHLLHVCAHGAEWNPLPPLRWIADAVLLLRTQEVDWERFVALGCERQLTVTLAEAVDYLARELAAPVPREAIDALRRAPVTRRDRAGQRAALEPPGPGRTLRVDWARYRRLRARTGFVGYLARRRGLRARRELVRYGVSRLLDLRRG